MKIKERSEKYGSESHCRDAGMAYAFIAILLGLFTEMKVGYSIAAFILLVTMSCPSLMKYPAILWFKFSEVLGGVSSKVLLTIIFFLVITPIAVFLRLIGKDQLQLTEHKNLESAFKDRSGKIKAEDLKDPF